MEPKLARSKAMHLLKENDDLLKFLVTKEIDEISKARIEVATDFELTKKYYYNQGIIEGLRRFMQKLNEIASREV